MATRQEIQIAQDLIKSANICQDLLNMAAKLAKGEILKTVGFGDTAEQVPMTAEEIQAELTRQMNNISNYIDQASRYLSISANRTKAVNGLQALGVDLNALQTDYQNFVAKISEVKTATSTATTQTKLNAIGSDIDKDIPSLNLLRNA